jgi:hypothetical protein
MCDCDQVCFNKCDQCENQYNCDNYLKFKEEKGTIIKYIKDSQNRKIGVLLSTILDDGFKKQVCFGWSLTNKLDKFDKTLGINIARKRSFSNLSNRYDKYLKTEEYNPSIEYINNIIPYTVKKELPKFFNRMYRYYKNEYYSLIVSYIMYYVNNSIEDNYEEN